MLEGQCVAPPRAQHAAASRRRHQTCRRVPCGARRWPPPLGWAVGLHIPPTLCLICGCVGVQVSGSAAAGVHGSSSRALSQQSARIASRGLRRGLELREGPAARAAGPRARMNIDEAIDLTDDDVPPTAARQLPHCGEILLRGRADRRGGGRASQHACVHLHQRRLRRVPRRVPCAPEQRGRAALQDQPTRPSRTYQGGELQNVSLPQPSPARAAGPHFDLSVQQPAPAGRLRLHRHPTGGGSDVTTRRGSRRWSLRSSTYITTRGRPVEVRRPKDGEHRVAPAAEWPCTLP